MDNYREKYQYGIYPITDPVGQELALSLMNQIKRWQKEDRNPSDPEQYIVKSQYSDVKIILLYDYGNLIGSGFVGRAEGYDLEKTRAIIEYGNGNPEGICSKDVWLNYQSWEGLPGESPTTFTKEGLEPVWKSFKVACREAYPDAERVIVRSRHYEIWQHVYLPEFWNVLTQIDLRGFKWTAPDGKVFKGYDERFSKHGILAMSL